MKRPKPRDFVEVAVVVWDDAHMATRQDDLSTFDDGCEVITAGIYVTRKDSQGKYVSVVSDYIPEHDQVRVFHNIPKAIVKKIKKVRVYL